MSRREDYEARTEELLKPIAEANHVSIYDVEYVKEGSDYYLRASIDKPEGVNIGDCENVSRALSDALDREDFIPDAYILEVSSPGLGRALKKDRHLQAAIGEEVEVKLFKPIDGNKEFAGCLESFDAGTLVLETLEGERSFARTDIAQVRLALDFSGNEKNGTESPGRAAVHQITGHGKKAGMEDKGKNEQGIDGGA